MKNDLSRRDFVKSSVAAATAAAVGVPMTGATDAALDSGFLCITAVEGPRKLPLVLHSRKIYAGRLDAFPGTRTFQAREIHLTSDSPVSLETDGEIVEAPEAGGTEFRFRVLPGAFPLVM